MNKLFDDYISKAEDAIHTGYCLDIEMEKLPEIQVATGAQIASTLERLTPKEEARIVRYVDDSRSLITEPTWCLLVYAISMGRCRGKMFLASKPEWDSSIAFNVRENFFDLDPDEIPLLVARCRYTLSDKQIEYFMETETGRRKMLQEYCEVLYIVTGDDGERTVKPEGNLTTEERLFFDRYRIRFFKRDEEYV